MPLNKTHNFCWIALILIAIVLSIGACKLRGDRPPRTVITPPDPPVTNGTPTKCEIECKIGHETSSCVILNTHVSHPKYKERAYKVKELFESLSDAGRIEKTTIMSLFDSPSDPCSRSGVDVGIDKSFSNFGKECELNYDTDYFGIISIYLPDKIQGRYEKKDDGYILSFSNEGTSVILSFENRALNADYGGYVKKIIVTKNRVMVETTNSCILLRI